MRDLLLKILLVMTLGIFSGLGARSLWLNSVLSVERSSSSPNHGGTKPTASTLTLKVWSDKGDQNRTYYVGERIYVSFSVTKDSYVTIYDVDSTGNVNILFPNPYHQDNLVPEKGRIYTIPTTNYEYDLVIKGPTGDEFFMGSRQITFTIIGNME